MAWCQGPPATHVYCPAKAPVSFRRRLGSSPQGYLAAKLTTEAALRKQYYFRPSPRGLVAWDVDRLVQLSSQLPRKRIPLSEIRELVEPWSGEDEPESWRGLLEHLKLIDEADLSFPIILSSDGAVMDGMHRVVKAVRQGQQDIEAVQFERDPEPDHVGLGPKELPY